MTKKNKKKTVSKKTAVATSPEVKVKPKLAPAITKQKPKPPKKIQNTEEIDIEQKEAGLKALLEEVEKKSACIEHTVKEYFIGWYLRRTKAGASPEDLTIENFCLAFSPEVLKVHSEDTIWPSMHAIYQYAKEELLKIQEEEQEK